MGNIKLKELLASALFCALTAVGGFIRVPVPGYPAIFTLQTFFVILSGLLLTPRYALFSQLLYLFIGLTGIPVFAYGGGIAYVLHPTFGFLLSFPLSALSISLFSRKKFPSKRKPALSLSAACFSGIFVNYILGMPYMFIALNYFAGTPITFGQAVISGCLLYLPFDVAKTIAAVILSVQIKKRLPGRRGALSSGN